MFMKVHRQGFSLIEVLVAMACSAIVIVGVYQMFHSQQQSYLRQDEVVEMQQNLRAGMNLMTKDIRFAGFDPTNLANTGFVVDFPNGIFATDIDYSNDTNIIAFTIDDSEDGIIQVNDKEQIAYRLNNNNLERHSASRSAWEPISDNIDALNFVYLDEDGVVTGNPVNFRSIEVSLLVRARKKDLKYTNKNIYQNKQGTNICPSCANDHYRRRLLSTTINIRNS